MNNFYSPVTTEGTGEEADERTEIVQSQEAHRGGDDDTTTTNGPFQAVAGENMSTILQELLAAQRQALFQHQQQPPPSQDDESDGTASQRLQPNSAPTLPSTQQQGVTTGMPSDHNFSTAAAATTASSSSNIPTNVASVQGLNFSLLTPQVLNNYVQAILNNNIFGQNAPSVFMSSGNTDSVPRMALTAAYPQPFQIAPGLLAYSLNQLPFQFPNGVVVPGLMVQPASVPISYNPTLFQPNWLPSSLAQLPSQEVGQPPPNHPSESDSLSASLPPAQLPAAVVAAESVTSPTEATSNNYDGPTGRPPIPLTTDFDAQTLNPYQCLLRQQIELFETVPACGVEGRSQGRNTPIRIGQVGE
jgi:hypothetical protein